VRDLRNSGKKQQIFLKLFFVLDYLGGADTNLAESSGRDEQKAPRSKKKL
jgi:hypothetical protein